MEEPSIKAVLPPRWYIAFWLCAALLYPFYFVAVVALLWRLLSF